MNYKHCTHVIKQAANITQSMTQCMHPYIADANLPAPPSPGTLMSSDVFGGNCGMHRALVLPLRACTVPVRMQDPQQRSALQLHS
jgi:hypothetical protein